MKITVFGGAKPKPGEPAYQEALLLGELIGQAGHTVLTGGYIGTMEAVSRGTAEKGGHVIGVTCEEIERWRGVAPNAWVQEEWRFPTLRERLFALMDYCDAAIALPGGAGTLAEISVLWNHLIIDALSPRPLILVGNGWQDTFYKMIETLGEYVTEKDRALIQLAPDVETAFKMAIASKMNGR